MNKQELKKLIPEFAKELAPVYEVLNWTWYFEETKDFRIPSVADIAELLFELLEEFKKEEGHVSFGGLGVSYGEKDDFLSLEFTASKRVYGTCETKGAELEVSSIEKALMDAIAPEVIKLVEAEIKKRRNK